MAESSIAERHQDGADDRIHGVLVDVFGEAVLIMGESEYRQE